MKYFYINNVKFNFLITKKSILDFCNNIKINIAYFCYHNKLSIAGNCRMCLIEITNSLKPVVSCTMLITHKMKIYTHSLLVKKARENILEFLLLNHPLDCPICDQGGECDLQDQSFIFGNYKKRFYNFKRIVLDKNISPIIKMLMTRCIHCTRCVRFSYEISGNSSSLLGVYNRGVKSEIGTYVLKTFNSELSGNLIDICPVGALTFKQYSFINRNWELKSIKSIDNTDGFGLDINVFLSNNHLIKIQPFDKNHLWISDKTRFFFDGMFSKERIVKNLTCTATRLYWKTIFQNIINILYFKDHLSKHSLFFNLTILINNQLDIDTLNFLYLLSCQYKFIKLKKLEKTINVNDHENSFILNSNRINSYLNTSQLCLLLNLNLRFEGSLLNLNLRQNFFKNNLKIVSINSITNLTYPTLYLGSMLKTINDVIEGNSILNQSLIYSKNPFIVHSSEINKRKDSFNLKKLYNILKKNNLNIYNSNWNGLNQLNNTLSDSGFQLYFQLKTFNFNSYKKINILYLVNVKFNFLNLYLKKYLELKLLHFFYNLNFIFLLEQNNIINHKLYKKIPLFNLNFFEKSQKSFLNVEGIFKTTPKILISNLSNAKSDKNIFSIFNQYLNQIFFIYENKNNFLLKINYLKYNFNNIDLVLLPSSYILSLKYKYFKNKICLFYLKKSKFKLKKNKFFLNKFYLWLEDFYLNSKDLYSIYSLVMLECSKSFRKNSNNFTY